MGAEAEPSRELPEPIRTTLLEAFERGIRWGLAGKRIDLEAELERSLLLAQVVDPPVRAVELGAGAGLVGLALAARWPTSVWHLIDRSEVACRHLQMAAVSLDWEDRVLVHHADAESVAADLRGSADLVVARCFGPPPEVAELGLPLLRPGGTLAVFEPPCSTGARWEGLSTSDIGGVLVAIESRAGSRSGTSTFALVEQRRIAPSRYPRRSARRRRAPLW